MCVYIIIHKNYNTHQTLLIALNSKPQQNFREFTRFKDSHTQMMLMNDPLLGPYLIYETFGTGQIWKLT